MDGMITDGMIIEPLIIPSVIIPSTQGLGITQDEMIKDGMIMVFGTE